MSKVNEYVKDVCDAIDITIRRGAEVRLSLDGQEIGRGPDFRSAVLNAFSVSPAAVRDHATELLMAAALSEDPDVFFNTVADLWGDEDEEGEEVEDDDSEGGVEFHRE